MNSLDSAAETYVRLTLALGEIDPYHVDAYFGPEQWKEEAKGIPLDEIIVGAAQARSILVSATIPSGPRSKFLDKQLGALEARANLKNGVSYSFDEESA